MTPLHPSSEGTAAPAVSLEEMLTLVGEFDAQKWASMFVRVFPDGPEEAVMVGWFANAIMAGHDFAVTKQIGKDAALLRDREEQGRLLADYERVVETSLEETPQGPVVWLRVGGERFGFGSAELPAVLEHLRSRTQGGGE